MIAVLTGMGLSAAAGLNAYIPFLIVALIAKYTDFIVLPAAYGWMESWWAIGIGAALLLTEVVVDKVPAVDTVNDAVQTFIRPSMGGLLAAATAGAAELDNSAWMAQNPWVGVLLGVVVAGLVHAGKTTARPAANVATLGVGAPVLSTVDEEPPSHADRAVAWIVEPSHPAQHVRRFQHVCACPPRVREPEQDGV